MSTLTKDDVKDLIVPVATDVAEIKELLKDQNGRLREAEKDVAVLKAQQPNKAAVVWGSAAGAFVGAIGLLVDALFMRR